MRVDLAVVLLVVLLAIASHLILFVLIRRWMDRDLALSFAGEDQARREFMLQRLRQAKAEGVKRRDLATWLERVASRYP